MNVRREDGQVLPLTALMMVVLVGLAGLVIDVGRVYLAQRQLQNAVDSTAVAVAQNMPDDYAGWCQSAGSTASTDCASLTPAPPPLGYGGAAGARNALFGYGVTANGPRLTFICSPDGPGYQPGANPPATATCPTDASPQDGSNPCNPDNTPNPPPNGCNAVTVSESATVKSTLAGIFGFGQFNLSASGSAIAPDQALTPIDVAVVLDTTGSMSQPAEGSSTVCPGVSNPDKLDCVKVGVKALLQTLYPCNPGGSCAGQKPLDKVELLAFPGLTSAGAVAAERTCNALPPNAKAYDDPQNKTVNPFTNGKYTFTVVPWENTYANWSGGKFVLNPNDPLVQTLQTGGNCGLKEGGDTSYTSVLQTAQDSLAALGNDGATHAIVVLGDGEANYGPIYTSPNESSIPTTSAERHTPCQQAVNVADGATVAGTTVYTIGYWSPAQRGQAVPDEDTQCSGMNGTNGCPFRSTNQFGCNEVSLGNPARPWPGAPDCPDNFGASPIRGCWTMYYMASAPADFYPDASDTSLTAIFKQIGQNLGKTRLISP
jgi:Putative Flp pilus-assembly TadE/G-like